MNKFIGKSIVAVAMLLCSTSCYDDVRYDYEVSGMYFSVQQPLRTVISESESIYDAGAIKVGVAIGGKLEVDTDDWAKFVIDESLIPDESTVKLMPSNYYTLSNEDTMVVSKSNNQICDVEVHFTDAFYEDPMTSSSNSTYYAIPFVMTDNSYDNTTLEGKNYTIVAVQYESRYSGVYYNQGAIYELSGDDPTGTSTTYKTTELKDGKTATFVTTAYRTVIRPSHSVSIGGGEVATGDVSIKVIAAGETMSDGATATELSVEVTAADGNEDFVKNSGRGVIRYDEETKSCEIEIEYKTNNDDGDGSYLIKETLTRRQDIFEQVSTTIKYWYSEE